MLEWNLKGQSNKKIVHSFLNRDFLSPVSGDNCHPHGNQLLRNGSQQIVRDIEMA